MEANAALKHWAKWAVDNGSWRRTCTSIERHWVSDPSRFQFPDDAGQSFAFRYDVRVAEKVEEIVAGLIFQEKDVLRYRHIYLPHLADDVVARKMGMSARAFDTILLAATVHFGQMWRNETQMAA